MRQWMRNVAKDERCGLWPHVNHDRRAQPGTVATEGKGGVQLARSLTYSLPCPWRILLLLWKDSVCTSIRLCYRRGEGCFVDATLGCHPGARRAPQRRMYGRTAGLCPLLRQPAG